MPAAAHEPLRDGIPPAPGRQRADPWPAVDDDQCRGLRAGGERGTQMGIVERRAIIGGERAELGSKVTGEIGGIGMIPLDPVLLDPGDSLSVGVERVTSARVPVLSIEASCQPPGSVRRRAGPAGFPAAGRSTE